MARRFLILCCLSGLLGASTAEAAGEIPGRFLLADGRATIELFDPASGARRLVATHGSEPAFLPSGMGFAYIREGGCYRTPHVCYQQYSLFEKSFREHDARRSGRRLFPWTRFFVRALDVAPNGRLVFSAEHADGKGLEIYSCAPDGSHLRRLTRNRTFDNDPKVAPDGSEIVFARKVHGRGQLFRMRIDGSHVRRVTVDGRRDRSPAWSPGGRRLVFTSQPAGAEGFRRREVYTVSSAGGREHRLTFDRTAENRPTYAPDGRTIAFLRLSSLWLMRSDGSKPRQILAPLRPPGFELGIDWAR